MQFVVKCLPFAPTVHRFKSRISDIRTILVRLCSVHAFSRKHSIEINLNCDRMGMCVFVFENGLLSASLNRLRLRFRWQLHMTRTRNTDYLHKHSNIHMLLSILMKYETRFTAATAAAWALCWAATLPHLFVQDRIYLFKGSFTLIHVTCDMELVGIPNDKHENPMA